MAQDIVCALDVRKYLATKISEDFDTAEYIEGSATLIMMSDTECLFRFETSRSSENLVAVLDDVGRFEGNLFTVFLSGKRFTFAIVDDVEYCLFVDAIQECRLLVNLAFRLDCLMRDQFFAGVYTTFAKDEDNKVLIEGIGGVRNNQHSMTTFNLFDPLLQHRKKTIVIDDHDSVDEVIDALSFHDDITNINCIFCNSQKSTEYTKKFYWHPYVPVNSKKQNVYMCYSCICNWKEYRERAVKDNQLIMVDELNEEICGELDNDFVNVREKFYTLKFLSQKICLSSMSCNIRYFIPDVKHDQLNKK